MNCRLWYASPVEGTYTVASATPVATCTRNATSVALPNTYRQSVPGGTGCSAKSRSTDHSPVRSSSHRPIARIRLAKGERTGTEPDRPILDTHRVFGQGTR